MTLHPSSSLDEQALERDTLWLIVAAPAIWAAHLILSYSTAAIWCAKFAGPGGGLGDVQATIMWYTSVALMGIAFTGWQGFRRHSYPPGGDGTETTQHDLDSPADRHRFLGFATMLLSGLSAVATLYVAFSAVVFESCL